MYKRTYYDVYLSLQIHVGRFPVTEVASRRNVQCLQLLLDKGADVNQQNKVSLFHHGVRSCSIHRPVQTVVCIGLIYAATLRYSSNDCLARPEMYQLAQPTVTVAWRATQVTVSRTYCH